MKLIELLTKANIPYTVPAMKTEPKAEVTIEDLVYDSRRAIPGTAFICLSGSRTDGHLYAINAYENGCRCFFAERELSLPQDAVIVLFENTRAALPALSSALFDYPQHEMQIIGVTGTKGKTTVTALAGALLNSCGILCGTIGTGGISYLDVHLPTANTTPESYELIRTFRQMADRGVQCVIMEVSSQALFNHRVDGIPFAIGAFTNLSPDHIGKGEHPDFAHYKNAKKRLFRLCKTGIFNADDPHFEDMMADATCQIETYGLARDADYTASAVAPHTDANILGMSFVFRNTPFTLRLPGAYNVSDALCALAIAVHFTNDLSAMQNALAKACVRGRFQIVNTLPDVTVIIDYAHNYISLKNLLDTVRFYQPRRIVCLFGSVGGRTQNRRKELGTLAAEYADFAIITSDNPDFEDPDAIIQEIAKWFGNTACPYKCITDRRMAIEYALDHALPGDVILLCGKGHEDYQLIRGVKEPFSEESILREYTKAHTNINETAAIKSAGKQETT